MAENSKIEWTDHTFNPWVGCAKVHAGCAHCYAETLMDHRYGKVQWGPNGTRVRTSDANWRKPLQWNRAAQKAGRPALVFCASLADVFEDWSGPIHQVIDGAPDQLMKCPCGYRGFRSVIVRQLSPQKTTSIPRRCIEASTSKAGVCSACGNQYAPVVETSRVPTRPGLNSKAEIYIRNKDKADELSYGNRDPQRHCTVTKVSNYLPTCTCNAGDPVPATVLDIFNGSGTTGQVAVSLGRRYVGCEINETYARDLAAARIETPLPDRKAKGSRPVKRRKLQRSLFGEGGI